MSSWNFTNDTSKKSISGYEDVLDKLKTYTKEEYVNASEDRKKQMVDEVFEIYRGKNVFPLTYYNEEGIKEEIQKCIDKEVKLEGDVLDLKFNQGQSLCRYLFPNLMHVDVANANNNSMYDRFYDDHKLKRAIDFALRFKKSATPPEIRTSLELIGGGTATNYKTMNAKALYEKYVPVNGKIYDFASGFGGRMLGALSSKNNYTYIGVEPNTDTFNNLNKLGNHIEQVKDKTNLFKIYCVGSEDFKPRNSASKFDFAFSSPPYYNLEKYSDEDTQCYNKFKTLDEWFRGYVRETIKNIHFMLKDDAYYAVNIADFNVGKDRVEYVDRWIEISKEEGFEFVEQIHMKLSTRKGSGHKDEKGKDKEKKEGIFIFQKLPKKA